MRKISSSSSKTNDLLSCGYIVKEIDPYKLVCKQRETFEGLYIILEGECCLSWDRTRINDPDLLIDHREASLNMASLKENLDRFIIPSRVNHNIFKSTAIDDVNEEDIKSIRTLIKGDKIGDFEYCLRHTNNIFTVTNTSNVLRVAFISLDALNKYMKHNPQEFFKMSRIVSSKCDGFINKNVMSIFFTNLQSQLDSSPFRKEPQTTKSSMTDFEATLKLYELNSSNLIPSHVPNSMNILLKTKLAEGYWHKKIDERKLAQQMENEIKINYFKSFHHQSARSRKQLEQLKQKENEPDKPMKDEGSVEAQRKDSLMESRVRLVSTAKIPINHPCVANVWLILKAVNRFKDKSPLYQMAKMARSKTQLMGKNDSMSVNSNRKKADIKEDEVEFDPETGDTHLRNMESKMKRFLKTLPQTSKSDGVTSLKRYTVDGKSIPQVGGTILVRVKPCSDEDHIHIQHHILPKDTLLTLQKYRASKPTAEDDR